MTTRSLKIRKKYFIFSTLAALATVQLINLGLKVVVNGSASGIVVADAVQLQLTSLNPAAKLTYPSNGYLYHGDPQIQL